MAGQKATVFGIAIALVRSGRPRRTGFFDQIAIAVIGKCLGQGLSRVVGGGLFFQQVVGIVGIGHGGGQPVAVPAAGGFFLFESPDMVVFVARPGAVGIAQGLLLPPVGLVGFAAAFAWAFVLRDRKVALFFRQDAGGVLIGIVGKGLQGLKAGQPVQGSDAGRAVDINLVGQGLGIVIIVGSADIVCSRGRKAVLELLPALGDRPAGRGHGG